MNLCIPIDENLGLDSNLCLHFSTAPYLMVIHPKTSTFEVFDNPDISGRSPDRLMHFLKEHDVQHVAVGGIGVANLEQMISAGIAVFSCAEETASAIVRALNNGTVNPVTLGVSCKAASGGRGFSLPVCGRKFGNNSGGCSGAC